MSEANKRLYRSRSDRMISGVCGGLGNYLNIDPTVIRVLFVLVGFITGFLPGIIAYLVLLFIVPEEPLASQPTQPPAEQA
jgi:phage shock protein C